MLTSIFFQKLLILTLISTFLFLFSTSRCVQSQSTTSSPAQTTTSAPSSQHNQETGGSGDRVSFTASVPKDRSVCTSLASRLDDDEILGEKSRLLPATMRVRRGIVRQSGQSRMVSPIFIEYAWFNASTPPILAFTDARGARAAVFSALAILGIQFDENDDTFWDQVLPLGIPNSKIGCILSHKSVLHSLIRSGASVFSDFQDASIPTLTSHLSLGRLPVVLMAGCRTSSATPWPLSYDRAHFGLVVGVDLDFVYVLIPVLAESPFAIDRATFLMRWHAMSVVEDEQNEQDVIIQRWAAGIFNSFNTSTETETAAGSLFSSVMHKLPRPPRTVDELDGVCEF